MQTTFLGNIVVGVTFSDYFPLYAEGYLGVFQFPYMLFVGVSEGCFMVSVTFFEICCEFHV